MGICSSVGSCMFYCGLCYRCHQCVGMSSKYACCGCQYFFGVIHATVADFYGITVEYFSELVVSRKVLVY